MDIQVGDRVTYKDGFTTLVINSQLAKQRSEDEIIKIERPKYEVIEEKKEILNKKEKEYLWNVIRPFKEKVKGIKKYGFDKESEYIDIELRETEYIHLPNFEKDTMYVGMQRGIYYTLKELGLEEN